MAEPEAFVFPHPAELTSGEPNLLVPPEMVLILYNRQGVRGESSTYVNGLVRTWFSFEAKSRGWASTTWLGTSDCEYPGPGCWLSILTKPELPPSPEERRNCTVTSTQPPEHPSVEFISEHLTSGIEPPYQTEYKRDLSHGDAQAELNAQEDDHTFAFLGYDEMITNLTHLVEILGWKLEPLGEKEAHVLSNRAGHKILLVQRFNHPLLLEKVKDSVKPDA